MYAILDIETTGGKFNEEGITEIAVYKYDGQQVVDQLSSLVNPQRDIQPFVERLTGINSKMLVNAPKFFELAKRIVEITEGCVIVAHNAEFDYRILQTEFRRLGYAFESQSSVQLHYLKGYSPMLSRTNSVIWYVPWEFQLLIVTGRMVMPLQPWSFLNYYSKKTAEKRSSAPMLKS